MPSNPLRLTFIDFARTYAVILALLAHAMNAAGASEQLGDAGSYIRPFTRMSTPLFLLIFGFMIEFIYVVRVPHVGLPAVTRRLRIRSFQCYFAYLITSLASVVGGHNSISEFLGSLVFFTNARFGNILRVYSILLLLSPVIIRLRLKYGQKSILFLLICVVMSFPMLLEARSYTFGSFNHVLNVAVGIGPARGGPSIWHATSIMLAGMYLASSMRGGGYSRASSLYFSSLVLLLLSMGLGALLIDDNLVEIYHKFVGHTYRSSNMVGYYLVGIICSVSVVTMLFSIIGCRPISSRAEHLLAIGCSSLFSYTFGNILLNLFGCFSKRGHLLQFLVPFLACVVVVTAVKGRLPFYGVLSDVMNLRYGKRLGRVAPGMR
jgi:hypothetical protein